MKQKLLHRLMQGASELDVSALEHIVGMTEALAETHPAEMMMQEAPGEAAILHEVAAMRLAPAVGANRLYPNTSRFRTLLTHY